MRWIRRSIGARSVTSRSKSTSNDCSMTCDATSTPGRRPGSPRLPQRSTNAASISRRSPIAKRAWKMSTRRCRARAAPPRRRARRRRCCAPRPRRPPPAAPRRSARARPRHRDSRSTATMRLRSGLAALGSSTAAAPPTSVTQRVLLPLEARRGPGRDRAGRRSRDAPSRRSAGSPRARRRCRRARPGRRAGPPAPDPRRRRRRAPRRRSGRAGTGRTGAGTGTWRGRTPRIAWSIVPTPTSARNALRCSEASQAAQAAPASSPRPSPSSSGSAARSPRRRGSPPGSPRAARVAPWASASEGACPGPGSNRRR